MGGVLSKFEYQTCVKEQLLFKDMKGDELSVVYGMSNMKCDQQELADFLEAIHTHEIDRQIEIALFGGTVQPVVARSGSFKEKYE